MSKTEDNLKAAFAGESQARNKYTFFANVAKKEGWLEIAEAFEETAKNEKEHAEVILNLLKGINDSKSNLKVAIDGENYEHDHMYPEFARIAREEGETEAARFFEVVAGVEDLHAKRFAKLLQDLEDGNLLKRETEIKWRCRECGYTVEGTEPPKICPLCGHSHEYYEPLDRVL
jgi:rubrerythrin